MKLLEPYLLCKKASTPSCKDEIQEAGRVAAITEYANAVNFLWLAEIISDDKTDKGSDLTASALLMKLLEGG